MSAHRDTKLLIFLILISSYIVSGQILTLFGNKIVVDPDENITCTKDLECTSCNKGRICAWLDDKLVQYATITCDEDSNTPYCNGGLCSKIPQPNCNPSAFRCPTDGVFPDPKNCSRYHMCAQGSLTTNECPSNSVYNHATGGCKYRRVPSDCVTFNCAGQDGRPIVYPRDDRIFGRCVLGEPLILGRCNDYERYDIGREQCVRNCKANGEIQPPDPGTDSCRKYMLCVEVTPRKYEATPMSCACNEGYDEETNRCKVNADCLKNVSKPLCPKFVLE